MPALIYTFKQRFREAVVELVLSGLSLTAVGIKHLVLISGHLVHAEIHIHPVPAQIFFKRVVIQTVSED